MPPIHQKTIGVLGGCSDVATAEYYSMINDEVNRRSGGWNVAETLIAGMNFAVIEACVRGKDRHRLQAYVEAKVDALIAGGADVLVCVSNTLHKVLVPILQRKPIPYIHIADPTGAAIRNAGLSRVALFSTASGMRDPYLRLYYERQFGLDVLVPREDEIGDIDRIIFDELVKSDFRTVSKRRYLEILDRMQRDHGIEGLIMGCTEIFLLIDQIDRPRLPMFNTAMLHCTAAADFALDTVVPHHERLAS